MAVLEIRGLEVSVGDTRILRGLDFDLEAGKTLGIVGESGCGKTMTGLALMGMTPPPTRVTAGSIKLDGVELVGMPESGWRKIRGDRIALVMQDPFTSLNPLMRVGDQVAEALRLHQDIGRRAAWERSVEMLRKVGVPAPESSARKYPHQMSGGQRQRVVIAIAFACKPQVLVADEPTTALDVTLQAQILRLIRELQETEGAAVMLISHDIGAIGAISHRAAVFYAGRIVESGPAEAVLLHPAMPYTRALLRSMPDNRNASLKSIPGQPPMFTNMPKGCSFADRCEFRGARCVEEPELSAVADGHAVACWYAGSLDATGRA